MLNRNSAKENDQKWILVPTKEPNMPTITATVGQKKYLFYSKYYPSRDAKAFAKNTYDENVENYIIYGLGLGYHINELEKMIKAQERDYHIYVIECNKDLFKFVEENINLDSILENESITLFIMENENNFYDELSNILLLESAKMVIHKPSLNSMPKEFIKLKYLLEEYVVKQNSIEAYSNTLDENFKSNVKRFDESVDVLFNRYQNKPLYLIAAGPSLDKNIHQLSNIKDKGIILSVGRAVRPLLAAGITPDYIIITDPSDFLYDMQLKDLDIEVPIIVLSTCDRNVMLNYKGEKYIALQEGYTPAEEYAKSNGYILVQTGGSVATTGLDLAIRMGCNPIIFVGQDLAFTDNKTHSSATFSKDISTSHNLREIEDIYGNPIHTSKNLYIYLRWIQRRIAEEKEIEFIDATEGGARIKGTKMMKLSEAVLRYISKGVHDGFK